MRVVRLGLVALALVGCVGLDPYGYGPLDPDAANIVPRTGFDAATVVTTAPPNSIPPGVEGSVLFIRLVDRDGDVVLDRPFAWPSDKQSVPSGDYTLVAYWRVCDGNCGNLSGESPICEGEVTLAAGDRVVVDVIGRNLAPGSECSIGMS